MNLYIHYQLQPPNTKYLPVTLLHRVDESRTFQGHLEFSIRFCNGEKEVCRIKTMGIACLV